MAWPAQRLQVAVVVGAAMSFGFDVINRSCRDWPAVPQTLLADVPVTLEDACADNIPFAAVAALVPALPALMLLPAFITMRLAVARAVSGCACTAALAASSRN